MPSFAACGARGVNRAIRLGENTHGTAIPLLFWSKLPVPVQRSEQQTTSVRPLKLAAKAGSQYLCILEELRTQTCSPEAAHFHPLTTAQRYLCQTREAAGLGLALLPCLPLRRRTGGPRQLPRMRGTSWAVAGCQPPQDSPRFLFLIETFHQESNSRGVGTENTPGPESGGCRGCHQPTAPVPQPCRCRSLTGVQRLHAAPVPSLVGAAEDPEARGAAGGQEGGVLVARPQPAPAGLGPAQGPCGHRRRRQRREGPVGSR